MHPRVSNGDGAFLPMITSTVRAEAVPCISGRTVFGTPDTDAHRSLLRTSSGRGSANNVLSLRSLLSDQYPEGCSLSESRPLGVRDSHTRYSGTSGRFGSRQGLAQREIRRPNDELSLRDRQHAPSRNRLTLLRSIPNTQDHAGRTSKIVSQSELLQPSNNCNLSNVSLLGGN